jgi:hypothetical protein
VVYAAATVCKHRLVARCSPTDTLYYITIELTIHYPPHYTIPKTLVLAYKPPFGPKSRFFGPNIRAHLRLLLFTMRFRSTNGSEEAATLTWLVWRKLRSLETNTWSYFVDPIAHCVPGRYIHLIVNLLLSLESPSAYLFGCNTFPRQVQRSRCNSGIRYDTLTASVVFVVCARFPDSEREQKVG